MNLNNKLGTVNHLFLLLCLNNPSLLFKPTGHSPQPIKLCTFQPLYHSRSSSNQLNLFPNPFSTESTLEHHKVESLLCRLLLRLITEIVHCMKIKPKLTFLSKNPRNFIVRHRTLILKAFTKTPYYSYCRQH